MTACILDATNRFARARDAEVAPRVATYDVVVPRARGARGRAAAGGRWPRRGSAS